MVLQKGSPFDLLYGSEAGCVINNINTFTYSSSVKRLIMYAGRARNAKYCMFPLLHSVMVCLLTLLNAKRKTFWTSPMIYRSNVLGVERSFHLTLKLIIKHFLFSAGVIPAAENNSC